MDIITSIEDCCRVVDEPPLPPKDAERIADALKVLADPVRLRLLSQIAAEGECCVCELIPSVGLSQPTVSHHLKVLHNAGFLEREKRGTWAYYRLRPRALAVLREALTPRRRAPV